MTKCTSCEKETTEGVEFECPKCNNKIFRCTKCRELSIDYKCKCGFVGP